MVFSENELIDEYAPLVRRHALHLQARLPANVELDDLIQAGMIGLLGAIRRYEPSKGASLRTYATSRIRGAMLDELRAQDWLPRSVRSKGRRIEVAINRLRQSLFREPTEEEVAAELRLSIEAYRTLLIDADGVQVLHFEDFGRGNEEENQGNVLDYLTPNDGSHDNDNPFDLAVTGELRDVLIEAIGQLPEREQAIMAMLYQEDMNQKEIAEVLDLTEGRISQLRTQAIARIRAHLKVNPKPTLKLRC